MILPVNHVRAVCKFGNSKKVIDVGSPKIGHLYAYAYSCMLSTIRNDFNEKCLW